MQKEIIDEIGSPAVKAYYDPSNALMMEQDVMEGLTILGDSLGQVHVKECDLRRR